MSGSLCKKCNATLIIQFPTPICMSCNANDYEAILKTLCRATAGMMEFTQPRVSDDETAYVFDRPLIHKYCAEMAFSPEVRAAWGYEDARYDALFNWMVGDYEAVALRVTPDEFLKQMTPLYYFATIAKQ